MEFKILQSECRSLQRKVDSRTMRFYDSSKLHHENTRFTPIEWWVRTIRILHLVREKDLKVKVIPLPISTQWNNLVTAAEYEFIPHYLFLRYSHRVKRSVNNLRQDTQGVFHSTAVKIWRFSSVSWDCEVSKVSWEVSWEVSTWICETSWEKKMSLMRNTK